MKKPNCFLLILVLVLIVSCSQDDSDTNGSEPVYGADQEDLDVDGLPTRLFSAQLPQIPTSNEYTIELDRWEIPNTNIDAAKTTTNLQAAIDWAHEEGYTRVILPTGEYLVGEDINDIFMIIRNSSSVKVRYWPSIPMINGTTAYCA